MAVQEAVSLPEVRRQGLEELQFVEPASSSNPERTADREVHHVCARLYVIDGDVIDRWGGA